VFVAEPFNALFLYFCYTQLSLFAVRLCVISSIQSAAAVQLMPCRWCRLYSRHSRQYMLFT